MQGHGLFSILTDMGEPFIHRSRFTGAVLGAADLIGLPGAGAARDFLAGGGGNGAAMLGPDRCGNPAFTPGESAALAEARFRCANPIAGVDTGPGTFIVDPTAALPGGRPFVQLANGTDVAAPAGTAVVGAFNLPAMVPQVVGLIADHHGQANPIRRCLAGMVLGKDDLCYAGLPNKWRKWPKAARPPVSASDAKAIRRAAASVNRVKRLAKSVGLTTKKR